MHKQNQQSASGGGAPTNHRAEREVQRKWARSNSWLSMPSPLKLPAGVHLEMILFTGVPTYSYCNIVILIYIQRRRRHAVDGSGQGPGSRSRLR